MSIEPKEISRTKRKTIALVVNTEAELIIRAPLDVDDKKIQNLIDSKESWIISKQNQIKTFSEKHSKKTYVDGDSLMFLGSDYAIEFCNVDSVKIDGNRILVPEIDGNAKSLIIDWYKNESGNILKERLDYYANIIGVEYKSFNISEAQTRWGSCGVNNTINLSWRLAMCPLSVIDYIVVHELSHIDHKNHSKEFWIRVKTILPNFKEQQNWLDLNKRLMMVL